MTTAYAEEPLGVRVPPLEPTATCDAAQSGSETASVRVADSLGNELDFCAHHYEQHSVALGLQGYTLQHDNRSVLTQNYKGQAGE